MNTFIKQYYDDFCTIRREFIVHGFMDREDNMYRINGEKFGRSGGVKIMNQRGNPADYKPVLVLLFLCSKSMNASTFELVMYPSVIYSSS